MGKDKKKTKTEDAMVNVALKDIANLCKRRGYIFQDSEIYGGIGSVWDYGPLGVELKKSVKDQWWRSMIYDRSDVEGLDAAILMNPEVWKASGHVGSFADMMSDCRECKKRFRIDKIKGDKCPECGGELTEPKSFNLMFKTQVGSVEGNAQDVYMRPETAQAMFTNFQLVYKYNREKLPLGIIQIGRGYRNEISPRQGLLRQREFNMAEVEVFVDPKDKSWPRFSEMQDETLPLFIDGEIKTYTCEQAVKEGVLPHEALTYFIGLTKRFLIEIGIC